MFSKVSHHRGEKIVTICHSKMVTHKYNSQKNRDTEKFENFDSLTLWIRNFPNGQLYPN